MTAVRDHDSIFRLDGRAYVIAGAGGGGIGTATTELVASLGGRVLCADRDEQAAAEVAKDVGGVPFAGDITDERDVEAMFDRAVSEFGRLDGVIDVVGGSRFTSIPELSLEEWHQQFASNLQHAFLIGKAAGLRLAERGGGSIVFVSSIAAFFGSRTHPAYSAAKLALVSWVRSLAEEFGPQAVRVNSVAPGATMTARLGSIWSAEGQAGMARPAVLGRIGSALEIAGPIAFLLSDAAGNVTGQTLLADGGASVKDPVYGSGTNPGGLEIRRRHHGEDERR
ncbi:SDR family NAD(P)-dependent oxidoreductase [Saccharopolyspora sp. ASAGF58]|uniref:SDR family NAD(P)-dependent oxidoreductase n=1 Tax=Saccharopolyspora sp. ASAGF58 TaxID=2719023 RepID=UPI00143FD468|nr:SDR family oxidoreductase [Saccharopolyspora sp. ASAGF58]QIZ38013.1 SDR family oxidoreductase [Saccharopolyspora sp. ASAGF58]